ncbi:hypothetical protein SCHPADRAFT_942096 [Schizopora paradoxa]|uniref:N-acetyltransferase domain-containing protein n=1 Tax=Schizopora paradoxa TaxID=27342 RepID=A0A0H2RHP2_9AGAM|nr:hypothetical protein SCHPADRAFT_942096 [Schizopora paradoxa]
MKPFALIHPLPILPIHTSDEKSFSSEETSDTLFAVDVKPLRVEHVERATESTFAAFHNDPLQVYVRAGDTRDFRGPYKTSLSLQFISAIRSHNKFVLTVDEGEGNVIATRPKADGGAPTLVDRIIQGILRFYGDILGKVFLSKEQKKRSDEIKSKLGGLIERNFDASRDDMFYIDLLATSPKSQGKGYGSALVAAVTSMADVQNRTTFLISSNIQNTAFYNSCGFVTVDSAILGNDNPSWKAPPIKVPLMVRKPNNDIDIKL